MKILATKKFEDKLAVLDENYKKAFFDFLASLKQRDESKIIELLSHGGLKLDKLYVYKIGDLRLFYNFTKDNEDNLVLLFVDLTNTVAPLNSSRDPRFNSTINPRFNSVINPSFNSTINPRFNSLINPSFNSTINPRFNSLINPSFNSTINPRFNSVINPSFNSTINPRFNSVINPRFNPQFSGFYYYDLDLIPLEFIIPIQNNDILLFFDFSNTFLKFGIKHNNNGYVIFDLDNNWIGHIESNKKNGFNYFDLENNWIGLIT